MMINDKDGKTAFDIYCRVPGTRCNAIMEMIDIGLTDKEIAEAVKKIPSKRKNNDTNIDCDADTIKVYRKAHDGKLTKPQGATFHWGDHDRRNSQIVALHDIGWMQNEIATLYGLNRKTVNAILQKESRPR